MNTALAHSHRAARWLFGRAGGPRLDTLLDRDGADSIIVVVKGEDDMRDTIGAGVELAQRRRARLKIVSLASPLPWIAYTGPLSVGWSPEGMEQLAVEDAERVRAAAVAGIPRWISVESRVFCGNPRDAVTTLVPAGVSRTLVMHRKRIRRDWMGRVRRLATAAEIDLHLVGGAEPD